MVTDQLQNLKQYRGLHKNLDTAIDFLQTCDLKALPDGKTVVDGERVFVNVMEADLKEAAQAGYEYHRRYADLQINLCGSEYWEWTNRAEHTEVFNEQADVGFAEGIPGCGGQLGDGRFALFLPGEYHKPSCRSDRCAHVRKAVVKIEMA